MAFTDNLKNGVNYAADTISEIASSIAEKNRLRSQLNSIKKVIKNDTATRDQAYIELGRYFYENLREGASAENEALCAVVDTASERISKASLKYIEVLNLHNETKIRSENAEKLGKLIVDKTKQTAQTAKEKGAQLADTAKDFAVEKAGAVKEFAKDKAEELKDKAEELKDKAADTAEEVKEKFSASQSVEIEELIREEQEKLKDVDMSAVTDAEPAAETAEAAEESPDSFDF